MYTFQNATYHAKVPIRNRKPPPWRIALLANLAEQVERAAEDPADYGAEYDKLATVEAIAAALEADGHWVHLCTADYTLTETLRNLRPDICFNIAEGLWGDAREAQVPAMCELLGLPYTASRVLANAISLDKSATKRIWKTHGLPTPRFQEFVDPEEPIDSRLAFPLLVKPAREGTGMGIDRNSVVHDERGLRKRISWVIETYRQPALVEQFLPGREFTVGFLGNREAAGRRRRPWLYDPTGYHFFPILELDNSESASQGVYGFAAKARDIGSLGAPEYICPAPISESLARELMHLAQRAAESIGAYDVSRVDLRLDAKGKPHLLEINTLPGLNPVLSDLCIMATADGISYEELITEILYLAAGRYALPFEQIELESTWQPGQEADPLPVERTTASSLRRHHGL